MANEPEKLILEVRLPREAPETPEAMAQFLAGLSSMSGGGNIFDKLLGREKPGMVFEVAVFDQVIHFIVILSPDQESYFESQLLAQYPEAVIAPQKDYLLDWKNLPHGFCGQLVQSTSYYYPLKTYEDFTAPNPRAETKGVDPLGSVLGIMAKAKPEEKMLIQMILIPCGHSWQRAGHAVIEKGIVTPDGHRQSLPDAKIIDQKLALTGFKAAIRLFVIAGNDSTSQSLLKNLAGSFGGFNNGQGNSLKFSAPMFWEKTKFRNSIFERTPTSVPMYQIFNIAELATLYHFPTMSLSGVTNLSWGIKILAEPPENLPISTGLSDEEKKGLNFIAKTEFRNRMVTFGIKKADRRKHLYIIGKSGTGKSTLLINMAISDMKNGEGLAFIDPHGDPSSTLLDFVPSHRLNDVIYLDPTGNQGRTFHLNPFEVKNPAERELVASGIVSIFYKLYQHSWGPRLEYVLRNSILTLLQVPNQTLLGIPELLSNDKFRKAAVEKVSDPVLKNFWKNEFDAMAPNFRSEVTAPILNKVGQFLSSTTIRNIVGSPKSTLDLEDIMNSGKILIVNLSQGLLGEDNSALLGAMFITKIQLAAMNRVNIPEEQRRDFFLYVDEFQNFATTSFIKILSEARKYRLDLTLANQYITQVSEEIQGAVFGNAGTLISFIVGADDAKRLESEFGYIFKQEDLVNLANYQIVIRAGIDGLSSRPFLGYTLPLPRSKNQNREKVIRLSNERYTKPIEKTEPTVQPLEPVTEKPTAPNTSFQQPNPQSQQPPQRMPQNPSGNIHEIPVAKPQTFPKEQMTQRPVFNPQPRNPQPIRPNIPINASQPNPKENQGPKNFPPRNFPSRENQNRGGNFNPRPQNQTPKPISQPQNPPPQKTTPPQVPQTQNMPQNSLKIPAVTAQPPTTVTQNPPATPQQETTPKTEEGQKEDTNKTSVF